MNAGHLPVTGSGVFTRGGQRAPAKRPCGMFHRRQASYRPDIAQPEPSQVWKTERPLRCNVTQRIAALIAILGGIGHRANAHAVQHDPDHALKWGLAAALRVHFFCPTAAPGETPLSNSSLSRAARSRTKCI